MKKAAFIVVICILSGWAAAAMVDNFGEYDLGVVPSPWTVLGNASNATIAADEGGEMYFTYGQGATYSGARCTIPTIANASTATFYTRIYVADDSAALDYPFGLSDEAAPTWFSGFEVQLQVAGGTVGDGIVILNARPGTGLTAVTNLNIGTWYNVWAVINTTADTYDVYVSEGADVPVLYKSSLTFRNAAAANDIVTFMALSGGVTVSNVRLDNIAISQGTDLSNPSILMPYNPSYSLTAGAGTVVNAVLNWNAAADPNTASDYAVNPDIVEQYVFVGQTGDDPNLYYKGAIGDPGTEDPASQISLSLTYDATYKWVVVEALDGYTQDLTIDSSTFDDVDPNNIVGAKWIFSSLASAPVIAQQPVDTRVFTTDPNAVFTVTFTSVNPVTATWYKNDVAMSSGGDVTIETDPYTYSSLIIANPALDDEDNYYCILSVEDGTEDDIQTAARLLVIKKTLAQFDFEQNLDDSSGNAAPSGQGKSVEGLTEPNELLATDVTLDYDEAGISGYAVKLNGSQFVDFGIEGYPKAGPLDTLGDTRGEGYEKQGFGRGMETGSMLCWVKPAAAGAIYANANGNDNTHFGMTATSETAARMIMRGQNYDNSYQELGTAAGTVNMTDFSLQDGRWHMISATWTDSTMTLYIDGEQIATNTTGFPEIYTAWERANILGASRTSGTRQILNSLLTGSVDSLRIYNYVIEAGVIADEYETLSGYVPCANHSFDGSNFNFINTLSSYCQVDLEDFAEFAKNWLADGFAD